jgi:toxin YhaV
MGDRHPGKQGGGKASKGSEDEKRQSASKAPAGSPVFAGAHGWSILIHPLLLDKIEAITAVVERERVKDPDGGPGPNAKLLGHLLDLMFDKIPQRPGDAIYRGGDSLPPGWFRGKTGNGRYRLFYRFDSTARLIVYAWVNDEQNLRTYGSRTDAYAVFGDMVADGNPPTDWPALRAAAEDEKVLERARKVAPYRKGHR